MTSGGRFFPYLTPAEIYRQLTGGNGAEALWYEQTETTREQSAELDRAELIRSLANTIKTGWQGEAGAGAYGAAMPLAERVLENADNLDHAQDLLGRQAESFQTAYHSVRPIPDRPEMPVDEKFPFDVDYDKQVRQYQDDAHNNIVVFQAYDGASHYNETHMPQEYRTSERLGGDVSVEAPADVIKVDEPGPGSGDPRHGSAPRDGEPGDSGGPRATEFRDSPGPGGPPSAVEPPHGQVGPGSQTTPNDYQPLPPSSYPVPSAPYTPSGQDVSGGMPVGGYSGGVGGFGPRGSGPGSTGGGPGPVRGPGSGLGPGAGAGALAAEEAAARRAAQAAAAGAKPGGVGPMGAPVGTGRGKNDEDTEHQRKVLIEADAESTFGSDVLTAPEVIGDDDYED
jgi:hypothetical protein